MLIVDPKYQRQGAGRLLVKWGTAIADRMGVEASFVVSWLISTSANTLLQAVVEAGDYGRGLYEQEGFAVVEKYVCPVPEKYDGRRKQWMWWMKRAAKTSA